MFNGDNEYIAKIGSKRDTSNQKTNCLFDAIVILEGNKEG